MYPSSESSLDGDVRFRRENGATHIKYLDEGEERLELWRVSPGAALDVEEDGHAGDLRLGLLGHDDGRQEGHAEHVLGRRLLGVPQLHRRHAPPILEIEVGC